MKWYRESCEPKSRQSILSKNLRACGLKSDSDRLLQFVPVADAKGPIGAATALPTMLSSNYIIVEGLVDKLHPPTFY